MSLLDTASLIVTPNAYKEGKLYSVIPSDGSGDLSVTRATTATRVNASGLVELVPYNLLQYSEQFENAWWKKSNTTVTANATTAPNGTLTADRIVSSNGSNSYLYRLLDWTIGDTYTLSFYVKADSPQTVRLYGFGNSVNLDVTTEWTRISRTFTATTSSADIGMRGNSLNIDFDIYIWGAQLVEGSTAKDYFATETRLNIPRLDYSLGSCPNILLEPQRTNLCSNSLGFSVFGGCVIASEVTNSPFGNTYDVFKVTSLGAGGVRANENIPFTYGSTYCCGHFIKFVTAITLNFYASAGHFPNTGNFIFDALGNPSKTGDVDYIAYPNGWYYVYIKASATSTTSARVNIAPSSGSFLIFKSQYELGAYPTSYIPTTSASVTRNADVISKTGISSLIGQTEGTMFVDIDFNLKPDNNPAYIQIWKSQNERLGLYYNSTTNLIRPYITWTGTADFTLGFTPVVGQRYKLAFTYKANDYAFFVNGSQVTIENVSITPSSTTTLHLGCLEPTAQPNRQYSNIKAAAIWKERLTNTQLAALTTL